MIRALALLALVLACGPGSRGGPAMNNRIGGGADPVAQGSDVASADILSRDPVANHAQVKHILIAWKELGNAKGPALERTKAQAEALVKSLMT
jgi:uncharacterized protein with LGFP repeats